MKKLTANQLLNIQNLIDNPLISDVSMEWHEGLTCLMVTSHLNSDWNAVDSVLEGIFPGLTYRGKPSRTINDDGVMSELYSIDTEDGVSVYLFMKKTPVGAGAEKEISQGNCIMDDRILELGRMAEREG